jgi:GT2 family glycosyltransferase
MVLNNDTLAAPSLVARLVRALRGDPRIALAAPVSNHVKGPARLALGELGTTAEGRAEIERALSAGCGGKLEDVETLSGLCSSCARS